MLPWNIFMLPLIFKWNSLDALPQYFKVSYDCVMSHSIAYKI